MMPRLIIPEKMWRDALDAAQPSVPWYDRPLAFQQFARIMAGLRT